MALDIVFDVNFLAVILAALSAMALGYVWYLPGIFGTVFSEGLCLSEERQEESKKLGMLRNFVYGFVSSLITAYMLAVFIATFSEGTLGSALILGFLIWAGFIATVMSNQTSWEGRPFWFYFNNASFQLVLLLFMALIIVLIG
ncbi:MAG: DUF1761 domain-containing protein [Candidatus Paceibacterota bacterium]